MGADTSTPAHRKGTPVSDRHDGHDHDHDHDSNGHDSKGHGHSHDHGSPRDHGNDHGHSGHDHTHAHPHPHPHTHNTPSGPLPRLRHLLTPHSHETGDKLDSALESSARGMRALWVSLVVLGTTALAQAVVVVLSGSVALLGDTVHNAADALTAVPLAIAFVLGAARRGASPTATAGRRTSRAS